MSDFAAVDDVPWVPASVRTVTVGTGVTQIGANAWSRMADSVVINGTALSAVRYLAPGVGSAQPAGTISPAEFERIDIVDGRAYLGVSVATSEDLTAETESWQQADIEAVRKESDGTVTLTIPATDDKGFMIPKSKGK